MKSRRNRSQIMPPGRLPQFPDFYPRRKSFLRCLFQHMNFRLSVHCMASIRASLSKPGSVWRLFSNTSSPVAPCGMMHTDAIPTRSQRTSGRRGPSSVVSITTVSKCSQRTSSTFPSGRSWRTPDFETETRWRLSGCKLKGLPAAPRDGEERLLSIFFKNPNSIFPLNPLST